MNLTTTKKGSGIVEHPADAESIKKCFDFPESAEYLLQRLIEKLKSVALLEPAGDLVQKVREYVDIVQKQRSLKGDAWSADPACERSTFQNLQVNLATQARGLLTESITEPLKMDYAVSDSAQFLRGYSVKGKPLDPGLIDACDKLFNAWLAEHHLLSKQGQIYEITENGEIQKDENGELMSADSAKVKTLFTDSKRSFQAYLANSKNAIQLTAQVHPYPEEKPVVKPEVKAPKVAEVEAPKPKVEAQDQGIKPEEPGGAGVRG